MGNETKTELDESGSEAEGFITKEEVAKRLKKTVRTVENWQRRRESSLLSRRSAPCCSGGPTWWPTWRSISGCAGGGDERATTKPTKHTNGPTAGRPSNSSVRSRDKGKRGEGE